MNDDLISRQAAIDVVGGWFKKIGLNGDICLDAIVSLPSARPERPKGEWIYQTKFGRIECDQCGKVFRNSFAPKNFCPNCGADMKGEQE